jgi:ketosteroid isomerase-like protein
MRPLTTALCALAVALAPAASAQDEAAEGAVRAAEGAWAAALLSKDMAVLEGVLAESFQSATVGQSVALDRASYLAQQSSPVRAYSKMEPTVISVSVDGDLAVVVLDMDIVWPQGVGAPTAWRYTDVWTRIDDEWLALARYSRQR